MKRQRGFTLIELIITMVLIGFLAVVGAYMMSDSMRASFITTHNQSSGSQARWAMERMVREIREMAYGATGGYSISTKTATSLAFTKENGTAVTITSSGNTVTLTYSGTTSTLTNQVATGGFAFSYLDQLGATTTSNEDIRFVQIAMTVTNTTTGQTESHRTRVWLRNAQASVI